MLDDNDTALDLYIWNTGRVMSVDKADTTNKLMGNMKIISDNLLKFQGGLIQVKDKSRDQYPFSTINKYQ